MMNSGDSSKLISVVIIAPGQMTEGGITTVVQRVHKHLIKCPDLSVDWIASHRSGNILAKAWEATAGLAKAFWKIPGADLIHIHSAAQNSFYRKSLFLWIATLFGRPVIWHLHAPNEDFVVFYSQDDMVGRYIRTVMSRCERVVVLSDSWLEMASQVLSVPRIQVIYNPIPETEGNLDRTSDESVQNILYLAHLIQRKGYPLLIQAFAKVAENNQHCRLIFAGSGEIEQAQDLCRELGILDRVEFLGWIGDEDRTKELNRATIFVLPSYQEGLPMGVLEAMAYGVPVITTPVGGIPDVIADGENGLLVPCGDVAALTDALTSLISDKLLLTRLGDAAKVSVEMLRPSIIASQWQSMYSDVVSSKNDCETA